MTPDKSILSLIKLQYRDNPEELEMQLAAWNAIPTLKTDCLQKSLEKARDRAKFVKELKQKTQHDNR